MKIRVLTIFPEMFATFRSSSLIGRALERGLFELEVADLRDFAAGRHRVVDDEPYGGGGGMVMKAEPWLCALEGDSGWKILMSPQGRPLNESKVRELATRPALTLLCGRYEGIDERVLELAVDEEISLGDFVLSGGELAAMVLIEAVSRQIPGVVQQQESVEQDSFRQGLLDYPHYTRPRAIAGRTVPEVLLGGSHAAIAAWRRRAALAATLRKRPDLLERAELSDGDLRTLGELSFSLGIELPATLGSRLAELPPPLTKRRRKAQPQSILASIVGDTNN